ncbi:MAG: hypothetical protein R3F56_18510 [Planctomycetota bacterium]
MICPGDDRPFCADRRAFLLASATWASTTWASSAWLLGARPRRASGPPPPPRHAALHLYTRPLLRARHAAVVRMALAQRAAAHTSGWEQGADGKPVLAVGPVRDRAAHWRRDQKVKPIDRAWPFAAVLEFDGSHKAVAYVDWFRRAHDSRSPDSWMLDPNLGYVEHINREVVCHRDARFHYLALVDTPTGSHVGHSDLVVRARVDWADGASARKGWWLWFEAKNDRSVTAWTAPQVPLVDWRVVRQTPKLGIVETAPVDDRERQLAPMGTSEVFEFPEMPLGLQPCRGDG